MGGRRDQNSPLDDVIALACPIGVWRCLFYDNCRFVRPNLERGGMSPMSE